MISNDSTFVFRHGTSRAKLIHQLLCIALDAHSINVSPVDIKEKLLATDATALLALRAEYARAHQSSTSTIDEDDCA